MYGNDKETLVKQTPINKAYKYFLFAQKLQNKYSFSRYLAWKNRKKIRRRINAYYIKASNILTDFARKSALKIIKYTKENNSALAREDLTGLINSLEKIGLRVIKLSYCPWVIPGNKMD